MNGMYNFPSWLGQNSKASKGQRLLKELQLHMHLSTSADANEIRQSYLPTLISKLHWILSLHGQECIPTLLEFMDHYHISREDFDTIGELYLGKLPIIPSGVKTAFTRA